ncbi:hypothetical protein HOLleu_38347 [Holothuria leucospilota]|uniref:Uncharacterized protein n=1 Tax=Holothuria leucospilota TaxID=206669 RepID=A0A9Q1BDH8_HOLLE|nr:hypothetical protein HOLleu_38347 [Holothuria leucospilota]
MMVSYRLAPEYFTSDEPWTYTERAIVWSNCQVCKQLTGQLHTTDIDNGRFAALGLCLMRDHLPALEL